MFSNFLRFTRFYLRPFDFLIHSFRFLFRICLPLYRLGTLNPLSPRNFGDFFHVMASKTATKDIITLRGSAAIVSEFFGYAANSILYNRGLYPEESFVRVKKYGLPMLLTQDEGVKTFISNLTAQLSEWLEAGKLQRVVLVIMSKSNSEVLERWNFRIETDGEVVEQGVSREKSDKEIMREIQAIMRQIASSITYLPCLDEPCVFDVLAYTDKDLAVPFTWMESDPKLIANPQMVKLHSFDTKIHKVDTLVSYKNDDCDEE